MMRGTAVDTSLFLGRSRSNLLQRLHARFACWSPTAAADTQAALEKEAASGGNRLTKLFYPQKVDAMVPHHDNFTLPCCL